MSTIYTMSPQIARLEIDRRLRDADDARRRRLARRGSCARGRRLGWR
ncbi:hypothetical protein ACT8ZV_17715 [Nocardioides sp. MAHUQ-72]